MPIYFVIAELKELKDFYAVKKIETQSAIGIENTIFNFPIDEAKNIYIGMWEITSHEEQKTKLDFYLKRYKSKINKDFYKIKLAKLLEVITYGCKTLLCTSPINSEMISNAQKKGREKRKRLEKFIELNGSDQKIIFEQFHFLENQWLKYWENTIKELLNHHKKNIYPYKKNYLGDGTYSLIFGRFNERKHYEDLYCYEEQIVNLCAKLAEITFNLRNFFDANCPGGCGEKILFDLDLQGDETKFLYKKYVSAFPIFSVIKGITGSCPECGTYGFIFPNEERTCVFPNYHESVYYNIGLRVRVISQKIQQEIYGESTRAH